MFKFTIFNSIDEYPMKQFLIIVFILTHCASFGQITDDFSDGDFTSNPVWSGVDIDYTVNPSFELQLNNSVASTSYLSTTHGLANLDNKEWHFWTKQTFAPSGSNFGRVYLTASNADLTTDPDGFYIQLGEAGATDAVRLFKVVSGVHTELLAGVVGQIAASFTIGVRVVRDNAGNWTLFVDGSGGTNYVSAGTVNDGTILLGTHFGFYDVYTASNANKFYYDNVYVGDEIVDVIPPILVSATAITASDVDVLFDEPLDQISAETTVNYAFNPGLTINTATLDGVNPALVHINLSTPMTNGASYTLTTTSIADISLNASGSQNTLFSYLIADVPMAGDVIINEFLCDESPKIGLPMTEYVEIYNKSNKIFDLTGWKLGDASSQGTIQSSWLLPGEYRILAKTSDVDSFAVAAAVSSFPSLNNSGDAIVLKSDLGVRLDSINYNLNWYHDETKEDGGYAIERINPNDPCSDISNWSASTNINGGTPGTINSVNDLTPDTEGPTVTQLIALAPNYLEVYYSEGMDSTSVANAIISTLPGLTIQNHYILESYPSMSTIQFNEVLTPSQSYGITLQNIADCWLNTSTYNGEFALAEPVAVGDVIINEIMFNPLTGGSDWVELYNKSDKLINLIGFELANYDSDTIYNNKQITDNYLLYPGSFVVLTENESQITQNYPASVLGTFYTMDLPSYNNDSSTVYLISGITILDKVSYQEDWHFALLDDDDGKSLERIDPNGVSNSRHNWHTAAESIGFATPGRENSQDSPTLVNGTLDYESETFSPDNDGFEDVLQVNYEMNETGYLGTFKVFDDRGREIATVIEAELLGTSGTFKWDGVDDNGDKASIGTYVGVFEAFNIDGGIIFTKRKVFVVAGML